MEKISGVMKLSKYYIGQFKNGLRNGKGKYYYSNGNIKYEGDYINGKAEGNGKYIWKNGEYYIGQFKNGLRNGKGNIILQMEIFYMKVIILMIKLKEMENIFGKMVNIIQVNLKMI